MNTKISVREAEKEDIPEICRIESECFNDPWSEAAFNFAGEYYFTAREISAEEASVNKNTSDKNSGCFSDGDKTDLFLSADTKSSYCPICGYAAVLHTPDGEELLRIATAPEKRGRGIGGALLDEVIRRCRSSGAEVLRLEVRRSNNAAIALYLSRGFFEIGVRRGYYRNPDDDAILMELRL